MKPGQARVQRLDTAWLEIDGFRVFMRFSNAAGPEAPPLVLVHGLAMSSSYLTPVARYLAPFYRVYLPDLPGFGRSQKPTHALTLPQIAQILAGVMDRLAIQPADFLGNSMGCNFIVDFSLRFPGRVRKMVLVGPTIDERSRSIPETLVDGARTLLHEPLDFLLVAAKDYLAHGFRRTMQTLDMGIEDPIEHKLPRVTAPGLVVRGEQDPIVSQAWAEKVAALLPVGRLVVIPGGAHVVHFEKPGQVAAAAVTFLRG